ncbi:MAG: BatA domain-containing protein [Pirellulaceae bacterium]|nr:BatA domain-containing protein [Pirellulaceae bacterium]
MGLLAPLYALAALAVIGPIIFHLIKRQPTGQQRFSSLMFLSPSPPRLTRRSRLDNILLLLLRALAILLIVAAFARPFFRQESLLDRALDGRNIALLIDTSASMQRPDVWASAQEQATKLLDSLSPGDRVSLYTIDDSLHPIIAFDTDKKADAASQQQAVRAAVTSLKPTWRGSKVAEGLRSLSDQFQAASIAGKIDAASQNELVFISDLHVNCGVESLQGYPWPKSVRLDVRQIRPKQLGNARASLAAKDEDSKEDEERLKVRVENNADSAEQSFQLRWMAGDTPVAGAQTTLQVPPGQVRMIPVPTQPPNADRLELSGDSWDGDNALYVAKPVPKREKIAFVGEKAKNKESDLAYFLEQAPLSTGLVRRTVERVDRGEVKALLAANRDLDPMAGEKLQAVIVELPLSEADAKALREFATQGGCVLAVLARQVSDADAVSLAIRGLFDSGEVKVSEAVTKDFALLSAIDYTSPVFKPFADPRFNDFSKIRVWTHRRVELTASADTSNLVQTIASLDDGSPWLSRNPVGRGNVWLMSSGWQPESSQLGLSSKFVPILLGMLDPTGKSLSAQLVYSVGDSIPVDDLPDVVVTRADGSAVEVTPNGGTLQLAAPGLYNLQAAGMRRQVAVQVPTNEVQLTPMDVDVFDQFGVEMGKVKSDSERKQSARQLQAIELEQKQRVWQWLLAAGLLVLAIETVLAGWFARKSSRSNVRIEPQTAG